MADYLTDKDKEILNALKNIKATLRIQAVRYGNENAAWILRHL